MLQLCTCFIIWFFISTSIIADSAKTIISDLCDNNRNYFCMKVKKGDTWKKLFPHPMERLLVRKINRTNLQLRTNQVIAVPKDLQYATLLELSPFPMYRDTQGERIVLIDLSDLAFGAYDEYGDLVYWGPMSGGKSYCPDVGRPCKTVQGHFEVYRAGGAGCKSNSYPVGKGGAPMPYCMFFKGGFAMHGSPSVPGYHASHGCVRMFTEDAKWLREEFVEVKETDVIVQP